MSGIMRSRAQAVMTALALALAAVPASTGAQTVVGNDTGPVPRQKKAPPIGPTPPVLVVEPVAMMIATFDANGDGKVTRDELTRGVQHSFDAIDTAHTGKMGYIAFADWAQLWLGDRNALPSPFEVDADGDNQITIGELQAQFARIFARLDRNGDGVLTRTELLTIRADVLRPTGNGKRDQGGRPR